MTLHVALRLERASGFSLDVTFDVPRGITALLGPSGSGKSTILAAIAGLLRPRVGRIALGSEVWLDTEAGVDLAVRRRDAALVFQSLGLFPHLTGAGNVAFGIPRAVDRNERQRRARAMLERFRVAHLAERKPRTFSGGEAQRVALARAFAMQPRVLLLDEPFSALDQRLRRELLDDVRVQVKELDVPVVHVTHQIEEAQALGERRLTLANGRVVSEPAA